MKNFKDFIRVYLPLIVGIIVTSIYGYETSSL